jgi:branched-chain amino acid transport system ATP-binding protein
MGTLLETTNLQMRFGGLLATNNVNFRVPQGEMRGIIGPNGAGKTTLVNLITGIYAPTSGDIRLQGESLLGLGAHAIARKGLVRSFQVCRLFGSMSLLDNLLLPYLAHGHRTAEGMKRARRFLDLTNLARLMDQPARSLSGGQRALLQVAAGFMLPDLVCYVLDEPFAGINPVIKETIIGLIEQENRARGVTFVIVSHEMAIMRRLCQKVTVMIDGSITAEGTLDEVASRPDVIAAYLGKAFA